MCQNFVACDLGVVIYEYLKQRVSLAILRSAKERRMDFGIRVLQQTYQKTKNGKIHPVSELILLRRLILEFTMNVCGCAVVPLI